MAPARIAGVLLLSLILQFWSTVPALGTESLSVKFKEGLFSIHSQETSLGDILATIEKQSGLSVSIDEVLKTKPVTVSFSGLDIIKSLRMISNAAGLGGYGLSYRSTSTPGKAGQWVVDRIVLVDKGSSPNVAGGSDHKQNDKSQSGKVARKPKTIDKEPYFDKRLNRYVEVVKGEVLVRFLSPSLDGGGKGEGEQKGISDEIDKFNKEKGTQTLKSYQKIGAHRLKIPATDTVQEFVERHLLIDVKQVYIEPVFLTHQQAILVNDSSFNYQWAIPVIQADKAWEISSGSPDAIVAVIDTGIDITHPDLKNNVIFGIDIVNGNSNGIDDNGHGTYVAGIIAAESNNSIGIAGISWKSKLMPVKVLTASGEGAYSDLIEGIIYAVDHGARIINLSLGGYSYSQFLGDAIQYAHSSRAVIVAAGGNENAGEQLYPAAYPNVIAVSATDFSDQRWISSNFGSYIKLSAPGVGVLSTLKNNSYGEATGTSVSTAHISGVAALILSKNPDFSNTQVENILYQTADDLGDKGWDNYYGFGRVNALKAIEKAGFEVNDMAITGIKIEPETFKVGEVTKIIVTVENQGTFVEKDILVKASVNGESVDKEQTVLEIKPGEKIAVSFNWSTQIDGTEFTIKAEVNVVKGETESNDNKYVRTFIGAEKEGLVTIKHKSEPDMQVHQYIAGEAAKIWPGGDGIVNENSHEIWKYIGEKVTYELNDPFFNNEVVTYGGRFNGTYVEDSWSPWDLPCDDPRSVSIWCIGDNNYPVPYSEFNSERYNNWGISEDDKTNKPDGNMTVGSGTAAGDDIIEGTHEMDLFALEIEDIKDTISNEMKDGSIKEISGGVIQDKYYNYNYDYYVDRNAIEIFLSHYWIRRDHNLRDIYPNNWRGLWIDTLQGGGALEIPDEEDGHVDAYSVAQILWDSAVAEYKANNKGFAYYYLGRIVHLLEDMTVPAHTHGDSHAPDITASNDDSYENYMGSMDSNKVLNYTKWSANADIKDQYKYFKYNDFDTVKYNIEGTKWQSDASAWYSKNNLFRLFWYTAEITDNYDSDDANGEVSRGEYNIDEIDDNDISDDNCRKIGEKLMPLAFRSVAELYRLFWENVSPPSIGNAAHTDSIKQKFIDATRSTPLENKAPLNNVHWWGGYWVQDFDYISGYGRSILIYNPDLDSVYIVHGDIWDLYKTLCSEGSSCSYDPDGFKGPNSWLGPPISNEYDHPTYGTIQGFKNGYITHKDDGGYWWEAYKYNNTATLNVSITGSGTVNLNPLGNNCTTNCSQDYTIGTLVTLTASANTSAGYYFVGWSGDCVGSSSTCTLNMSTNRNVGATFALSSVKPTSIYVTINLNPSTTTPFSTVNVSGRATYNTGSPVTFGTVIIDGPGSTYTASLDSSGNYSRNITAPDSPGGYIYVTVTDGILPSSGNQAFLTITGGTTNNLYAFDRSTMSKDMQTSDPWNPINETDFFRSSDSMVYVWFRLTDIFLYNHNGSYIQPRFEWYRPNGTLYTSYDGQKINDPGYGYHYSSWQFWSYLPISGYDVSDTEGRWSVKILIFDGNTWEYKTTEYFTIRYEFAEHKMAHGVQSIDPWEPIYPTNIFYTTYAMAYTWARANNVTEGFDVKWEWYEPNGSLYSTTYTATQDPKTSGYDYREWTKFWGYIYINGASAGNKSGDWHVNVYIKDPFGNWDLEYTDNFKIIEDPSTNPSVNVTLSPSLPTNQDSLTLNVSAGDNTYLKRVILYWNDGTLRSQTWDNIFASSVTRSQNIGTYPAGTTVEFYAVSYDTSNNMQESERRSVTIKPDTTSLWLEMHGNGRVTLSPPGLDCTTNCSQSYARDTLVTLIPQPNSGWAFSGWNGDPDCLDGQITMNTNISCVANFTSLPIVTITTTASPAKESGPINGFFTISRTGSTAMDLTANYTVSGSATAGSDYISIHSNVTIPAGSTDVGIAVTPIDDILVEGDETVIVTLDANPSYIIGTYGSATVTIISEHVGIVTINFDELPDRSPAPSWPEVIDDEYSIWGVTFSGGDKNSPSFLSMGIQPYDWPATGQYAFDGRGPYEIHLNFNRDVYGVSAKVFTASGYLVRLFAYDDSDSEISQDYGAPPQEGYSQYAGTLSVFYNTPIRHAVFKPDATNVGVGIEDLTLYFTPDSDLDGIPDFWEMAHFGDLTAAYEATDYDNDGLPDKIEYPRNTDPKNPDSDGDGMPDGYEVANSLDPLDNGSANPNNGSAGDPDNDNYTNRNEYLAGSGAQNSNSFPVDINIVLHKGFNVFGYPVTESTGMTSSRLLALLGDSTEVERILVYDETNHTYKETFYDGVDPAGDNMDIGFGDAIIVSFRVDKTISFNPTTRPLNSHIECAAVDLSEGLNVTTFPCVPSGLTAFQILSAIGGETVGSGIQRFNSATGRFNTAVYENGQPAGVDFEIVPGEGYFVYMKQERLGFRP